MKLVLILILAITSLAASARSRGLIIVIDLAEEATKHKLLYKTETKAAVQRIKRITKGSYDQTIILHRQKATKVNFVNSVELMLKDQNIEMMDVIIYVHGKNESYVNGPSICFVGDSPCTSMQELSQTLSTFENSKSKLRALYSDACWGRSHLKSWIDAGFKVANGSRGVDSNHSLDLRRFLTFWVEGKSFEDATHFANKALLTRLTDDIIKNADSFKEVIGVGQITIDSSFQLLE